ncbi:MAG: LptF/LptG family permease [Verrucomicrobiota bacterium]
MRLLDRYLLRELLIPLGYCLTGFFIFWISFDLFSELSDFQANRLTALEIARYYVVKTPELLVTVMPIALLLALLYALTNHARHHELTAIKAAGVSLWRLSAPYFAVGLVFSALLFALNEIWVPESAEMAEQIRTRQSAHVPGVTRDRWQEKLYFRNARDGRIWNIEAFNLDTFEMRNPQVEWNRPDGSIRRIIAARAVPANGGWAFHDVQELFYRSSSDIDPQRFRTNLLVLPEFSESPEQIQSEIKISRLSSVKAAKKVQLSMQEILDYLRLHPDLNPRDESMLKTQLHARLAAPWTCLVVVLIAIPFGAPSGRRNVFVGVAGSIFIAFGFFILLRLGLALGTGGYVAPWLAAWLPNILFAVAGLVLTQRVR